MFQTRRCSACGAPLDLPTVHFLCKHSFHQRCLNSSTGGGGVHSSVGDDGQGVECPQCAPANRNIRAFRTAQEEAAGRHELFKDALGRASKDRFQVVGEFFGRGVMGGTAVDGGG